MHLVVAYDGSEPSEQALAYACTVAERTDGRVTAVYAVDPQVYDQREGGQAITDRDEASKRMVLETIEKAEGRGEETLEEARAKAPIDIDTELRYGDPKEAIPSYLDEDVEALVVGHRALGDKYERVLGSVAKGLLERSPVPVTVVRQ